MDIQNEIWRDVVCYEGCYQVSNFGRVKSLGRVDGRGNRVPERILKPGKTKDGYLHVVFFKDGKSKTFTVHRLVGTVFADMVGWTEDAIGKPFAELQINHKKEGLKEKANNHVSNLEWITLEGNLKYGTRTERIAKALSKPVAQKTTDGTLIRIWPSLAEIQRQTGWSQGHISQYCNGKRKSAYGFLWEFVN